MELIQNYINVGDALASGFYLSILIILIVELTGIFKERSKKNDKKFRGE